jgi:hypothetical protein
MKDLCQCGSEADDFLAKLDGAGWTLPAQVGEAWLCAMCLRERRGPAKAQRWDMPTNPEGRMVRMRPSVVAMSTAAGTWMKQEPDPFPSLLLSSPAARVPSGRS